MEPLNVLNPSDAPATAELAIEGMTCGGCAAKVQRTLATLPGVVGATVDLSAHRARVGYDPARIGVEAIAQAVVDLDYAVRPV